MLTNFDIISTSPNWTFVFCALQANAMVECSAVASDKGYKVDIFIWEKPDLVGQSHTGGPRQAVTVEYIVAVYKHEATSTSLAKHYALLAERERLVSQLLTVCLCW
jgi:hypothetical protein